MRLLSKKAADDEDTSNIGGITTKPSKTVYEINDIKVYFDASPPKNPGAGTFTTDKEEPAEAENFSWLTYAVLFSSTKGDEVKFYILKLPLNTNGSMKEKGLIHAYESDSDWSDKFLKSGIPSKNIDPEEILGKFPDVFKGPNGGPNFFPRREKIIYRNIREKRNYSNKDFERFFDNDSYVVLDPTHPNKKVNPFGKNVIKKSANHMSLHDLYTRAVKTASEKEAAPFTGGFDIMERLYKKQHEEQQEQEKAKKALFTPMEDASKSVSPEEYQEMLEKGEIPKKPY